MCSIQSVLSPTVWRANELHMMAGPHGHRLVAMHAGVTTEGELASPENKIHPDFVTSKLPDLLEAARGSKVPA